MLQFIFSIVLMLAVVGGLSQWMILRDRRNRGAMSGGEYRRLEFDGVQTTDGKESHAGDH